MKRLWAHPLTRRLDPDDSRLITFRRQIIQEKGFLRRIYQEWYQMIALSLPTGPGSILELGSGPGFLYQFIPGLIASDVSPGQDLAVRLDGAILPFIKNSLRAIVMTDVLHHITRPRQFFLEATRCVRSGGAVVMIEPWVTSWSRFVYTFFHHEPFNPEAVDWEFPGPRPMAEANGALPWIIFDRDREKFNGEFPQWRIQTVRPLMPFCYLISGGVSWRSLMPGYTFGFWRGIENALAPWIDKLAMFAFIQISKVETSGP
jgi:SAM-dependent methyltransferase